MNKRFHPPIRLLIVAALLLVCGFVAQPIVAAMPEKSSALGVLINGIPFLFIFVAILLTYIALIITLSRYYSGYVSEKRFKPVLFAPMVGIVLGVIFMFQPLMRELFTLGFIILLVSLLSFIAISHIVPKKESTEATSE